MISKATKRRCDGRHMEPHFGALDLSQHDGAEADGWGTKSVREDQVPDATQPKTAASLLGRLDTFQKVVAAAGAIITAWGAYVTIETNRNGDQLRAIESRLTGLKEERSWAKELYVQFDGIVSSKDATEQARIDRLAGLLALAQLTDQRDLKAQWALLIRQQAERYAEALSAKTPDKNATVDRQLQQYRELQQEATSTVTRAKPSWSNYDFDIFWCPGEANKTAAEVINKLKNEDPDAVGNWRLREAAPTSRLITGNGPYSVVWDYPDEEAIAHTLATRIRESGPAQMKDIQFRILESKRPGSRWYLSIYVCR